MCTASVHFIGRISREVLTITNPAPTVYVDQMSGWLDAATGRYAHCVCLCVCQAEALLYVCLSVRVLT